MLPAALLAVLVASAAEPTTVAAVGPAPPGAVAAPMPVLAPAWLDLVVNGVPRGTALVHLSGANAWIAAEDLERAGVRVEGGDRIERAGRSLVSLASLAPGVTFQVDEAALAVRIVAGQPLLGRTTLDLAPSQRPAGLLHREAASAYLNLSASGDTEGRASGDGELAVAVGPGLLFADGHADRERGFVRGLTTGQWDDRARLLRYTAGDVVLRAGDSLAGTGVVLGGSVGRELSLDPYLVQLPYPRTTVFSPTPATLEVWVDNALVRRTQVQPGTLDLENIPVNAGVSQVRTVLRDPFGRESSASTYALLGSTNLAPGLVDWNVGVGARRLQFGVESFDYGKPLGQAFVRAGVTPLLTLGGRVEGGDGLASGGATVSLASALAELELTVAGSVAGADTGAASALTARRRLPRGALVAQLRWDSGRYANGSLSPDADRALSRAVLTGSFALTSRLSLVAEVSGERRRDTGRGGDGVLRLVYTLPRGFFASASVTRTLSSVAPDTTAVLVSLSMLLPGRTTAEVQGGTGSRGAAEFGQASLTRDLPVGPGYGYRLVARGGDGAVAEAELRAQNRFAYFDALHQQVDPFTGRSTAYSSAQVASGLVFIDGQLLPTRPIQGAYALVKLDDAPGVRVLLQGQDMGRTDRGGDVLVTGLQPNLGNRISIRDSDLPLDFRVDEVERVIAPRARGGTVERFRVARQLAVSGKLVLDVDGQDVPPEWGEVAVELPGRRAASPVGHEGLFWLEMIPPGTHDALIRWEGRLCRVTFEVPRDAAGVVDLGKVRCTQLL
jgi:outer membrane usher protein